MLPVSLRSIRSCRAAMGTQALTEHSLRRMGAQFYARRGVPLFFVQVLGRWGSATIERHVADGLAEGVAGTLGSCARLGHIRHAGGHGHPGRSWHVSPRLVLLGQAVRWSGAYETEAHGTTQTIVTEVHAHSCCEAHGAGHLGHCELPGQTNGDDVRPVDVVGVRAIRATRNGSGAPSEGWEDRDSPTLLGRLVWLLTCHWVARKLQRPRDHLHERLSAGGDSSGAGAGWARARPAREPPRGGPTRQ